MRRFALFAFGLVVAVIVALGLVVLSSASEGNALRLFHDPYYFIKRQFLYLGLGLVVATAAAWFDYRKWRDWPWLTWGCYAIVFALLLLVFRYKAINGSHRWINLGIMRLQPSELAKLMTVIVLAVWTDRASWKVELFGRGACCSFALIGIMAAPILKEPDFGSFMVVGLVGFMIMFLAGVRVLHLLPFLLAGGGIFVWKVAENANRMARIAAWVGIKLDVGAKVVDAAAERAAYQAQQALIAIGRGDIWGVGLNQSMQKHAYLPEAHTDFIFAIGAEELGLFFSLAVILLFSLFFALSVYIARKAADRFGRLLVMGMASIIFFQAMFNLGVVCEALPTKGMALPFFSYGGTNMLASFFAVGTILSVGIHSIRDSHREFLRRVLMRGANGR